MTFAFALPDLSAGGWIDLACAVALGLSLLVGAVRGVTGQAARLGGFVSGFAGIAALHPAVRSAFFDGSGRGDAVLALASAVVGGALVALVVRSLVSKFLRLVIGQPADAILGAAISGAVCAMALAVAFSAVKVLPFADLRRAAFEESTAGRILVPAAERLGVVFPGDVK